MPTDTSNATIPTIPELVQGAQVAFDTMNAAVGALMDALKIEANEKTASTDVPVEAETSATDTAETDGASK